MRNSTAGVGLCLFAVLLPSAVHPLEGAYRRRQLKQAPNNRAVLWRQPQNIAALDVFHGVGGKQNQPPKVVSFVKEDSGGSNPKFIVQDSLGRKWKVKLGPESGPETTATRLMWAVGYLTDEDYFCSDIVVEGLRKLRRGQQYVSANGKVRGARLERLETRHKVGSWNWRSNVFTGTREFNGLAVMMALISNWDLKGDNNAIYQVGQEFEYRVTDLGATFGDCNWWVRSKADLAAYHKAKFLRKASAEDIDLRLPTRPPWLFVFALPFYVERTRVSTLAEGLPIRDVEWIGRLLGQLSARQISDAFRAGGFQPRDVVGFSQVVQERISELRAVLSPSERK